jgi:threonine dehydratase
MVTLKDIQAARKTIKGVAVRTPLVRYFPTATDGVRSNEEQLFLKAENFQPIGSFKLRGAYNKVASLTDEQRARGVVTYSSGNHAQGVAYAARAMGCKAVIVMPRAAPKIKRDATAAMGAEIVEVGSGSDERMQKALELSEQHGYAVIPPYNDEKIVAGQGTIGLEILEDLADVELVLVPVGGGGLSSGVAAAIKLSGSKAKVIGVEPELANDAQQSLRAGKIVAITAERSSSTLADGLRTQSIGQINFDHLSKYIDDIVTVGEDDIRRAMQRLMSTAHLVVEPSGAVTFAAWAFHGEKLPESRKTVAIVSGGNAEPALLAQVLATESSEENAK